MKKKGSKQSKTHKKTRYIIVAAIIFSLVSWDILTSDNVNLEIGTFRLESEFDAVSGSTVKVGVVPSNYSELSNQVARTVDPGEEQIELMVRKAIELQGGIDWLVNKGDKVMLKINLVGADKPVGTGENTDYRVVKALMKVIHEVTEGEVELIIAEGTARTNDNPEDPGSVWENSGYTSMLNDPELADINFRFLNLNQTIDDLIEINLGKNGTSAPQDYKYHVHKEMVEADVYIAVPVLKIHDTGITNALKLQIGCAPGCYYGYNKTSGTIHSKGIIHDVDQRRWTTEAIVDLSKIADIDFVVVDAIMCLETYKTDRNSNRVRFNSIIAGADPVAVDHVSAKLLGLNPDDVAHITLAEKVGLGTNNADNIEIVGESIASAMMKFKQNTSENGKFGQSNRIWLLSKAYSGADINKEYISNEAGYVAKPYEDDWSEATYFFDDRIDLLSYYNAQTDICTYAFTYFQAEKDQKAELWIGSHESMKVYLNGQEVYAFDGTNAYGNSDLESDIEMVDIKQGENTLLVKTTNTFGDYSFVLNICEVESNPVYAGNRVEGLKFTTIGSGTSPVDDINDIDFTPKETLSHLKLFPNPVANHAKLSFQSIEAEHAQVKIYSMNGQLVSIPYEGKINKGANQIALELSDLASGSYYICRIEGMNSQGQLKFFKRPGN